MNFIITFSLLSQLSLSWLNRLLCQPNQLKTPLLHLLFILFFYLSIRKSHINRIWILVNGMNVFGNKKLSCKVWILFKFRDLILFFLVKLKTDFWFWFWKFEFGGSEEWIKKDLVSYVCWFLDGVLCYHIVGGSGWTSCYCIDDRDVLCVFEKVAIDVIRKDRQVHLGIFCITHMIL